MEVARVGGAWRWPGLEVPSGVHTSRYGWSSSMHPGPSTLRADAASDAEAPSRAAKYSPSFCAALVAATARDTSGGGTVCSADSSWQITEGEIAEPPGGARSWPNSRWVRLRRCARWDTRKARRMVSAAASAVLVQCCWMAVQRHIPCAWLGGAQRERQHRRARERACPGASQGGR